MAKAKATANTAAIVLAKMLGVVIENADAKEIAAILKEAGLTVSGGKVVKAEKGGKGGKKAKVATVAQIVKAVKDEEAIDLTGVSEDDLREAVVKAKLAKANKAKGLEEEDLIEMLNEAMGAESDEDEEEDEEEDEDEDDSDDEEEDEDGDDEDDEDDDSDDEDEDEDDEDEDGDDEDEDEDDEDDEDEDEDEDDEDGVDLDNLDKKELLALVLEHKLATKAKAKKMDEDELRELCEAHFGGEDDEDEDEDEDDEDFDDEDEDEDDE